MIGQPTRGDFDLNIAEAFSGQDVPRYLRAGESALGAYVAVTRKS
jgi:hypothetical protein